MIARNHKKLAFLLASLFALFTFSGCVSIAKLMGRKLKMSDITEKINTDNMKAMDFTGKIMTEACTLRVDKEMPELLLPL